MGYPQSSGNVQWSDIHGATIRTVIAVFHQYKYKYNVVTSQVIRFSRICSRADQFIYHTAYLLAFLYKNRLYSKKRLFSITRRSLPLILPRWKFHNPKTAFKAIERRFQRLLFENSILNYVVTIRSSCRRPFDIISPNDIFGFTLRSDGEHINMPVPA